jgi:SAM-dependent methyltransferase
MDIIYEDLIDEDYQIKNKNYDIIQHQHRNEIINKFNIKKNTKVLEIGCGQGNSTYILASKVGENGLVVGIDTADENYGSPMTLEQSLELLLKSKLGKRINIKLNTNLLNDITWDEFKKEYTEKFDYIVFMLSSWYIESEDQFKKLLIRLREIGNVLCFADFNPIPIYFENIPHYIAITLQSELYNIRNIYIGENNGYNPNVRSIFTVDKIKEIMIESKWKNILNESEIETDKLQDGKWEVSECLSNSFNNYIEGLNIIEDEKTKEKIKNNLYMQLNILKNVKNNIKNVKTLKTFCIVIK